MIHLYWFRPLLRSNQYLSNFSLIFQNYLCDVCRYVVRSRFFFYVSQGLHYIRRDNFVITDAEFWASINVTY